MRFWGLAIASGSSVGGGGTTFTKLDMSRAEVMERKRALEALVSAELASLPSTKSGN